MRKIALSVAVSASLFTASALAYIQPDINVETTSYLDTETGQKVASYTVNGIGVELTKKDKVKADFWGLSHSDYAKYLFVMEYTPRGLWTPELDPPIVLGNLANTHEERYKYAELMNRIENDRRTREVAFQHVAHEHIEVILAEEGYIKIADRPDPRKGEFSKHLPDGKYELRSLFVDLDNCEKECQAFVRRHILISGSTSKFDIYTSGGKDLTDEQVYRRFGIGNDLSKTGDFNIARDSSTYRNQVKDKTPPFLIQQTDDFTKIIYPD